MLGAYIKLLPYIVIFGLISIILACSDHDNENRPTPKAPPEKVEIVRFEKLLCTPENTTASNSTNKLLEEYPVFTDVFFNQVIFPQNTTSIKLEDLIQQYCESPAIQHLIDTTEILFPELNKVQEKLGQAFGYFHYYFQDQPIPKVFTYVSEFGIGTFTVDTKVLAIGLDFFLGAEYPYYDPAVFPRYLKQTMTPEYMVAKAVRALTQVLTSPITTGNLLDYMIYNGKNLYLTSMLLPEEPMYTLTLYTPQQMEWVQNNELNIWSYLLDLDYFYETDHRKFVKIVDPSPTTPGLPEEAPGRVANWIGYRIVESYMNQHPEVSLKELAVDTDFQKIMDQSNYKPQRPQ